MISEYHQQARDHGWFLKRNKQRKEAKILSLPSRTSSPIRETKQFLCDEVRWVLCLVLHRTWGLAGSPVGWRQDSGDGGQSTVLGESQHAPPGVSGKGVKSIICWDVWLYWVQKVSSLQEALSEVRTETGWVRLSHRAGLLLSPEDEGTVSQAEACL